MEHKLVEKTASLLADQLAEQKEHCLVVRLDWMADCLVVTKELSWENSPVASMEYCLAVLTVKLMELLQAEQTAHLLAEILVD